MRLSRITLYAVCLAAAGMLAAGCATTRMNLSYDASRGNVAKLEKPVAGALISVVDAREKTKAYPKQIIEQVDYSGNASHDINDKTVQEVFTDALTDELRAEGVELVRTTGVKGPLDKETAGEVRKEIETDYPGVQVAFGAKVIDFTASTRKQVVTTKAHVSGWMQLYILDVKSGDLLWSDYKTEWDDTLVTANRDDMIEELDNAIADLMHKSIRNNMSLRDLLIKVSGGNR